MKKTLKYFAAAFIIAIAASCSKEAAIVDNEIPAEKQENPAEEAIPEGYVKLTFTTSAAVKTSVSGKVVSWSANDQIKVCWDGGSAVSESVVVNGSSANFTVTVDGSATDFYAVYPSSINAEISQGTFNVDIPQDQSGRFADADILVAKTTASELTYAFHHAVSLVHFEISSANAKSISRAKFVDLTNNSALYGTVGFTFDANNDIETTAAPAYTDNDVINITAVQSGTDNYIAVIPGKDLAGFGLRLGSASEWFTGLVGENAIPLGERLGLGEVDTKINDGDWYIKETASGTGDGTSWANAGGPELLQSLMGSYNEYQDMYKNLARGWRIDGKTVKIAEGEYAAPGSNGYASGFGNISAFPNGISYTLEGGYTESGVKNVATAKTIFGTDDDSNPSSSRAFFFYHGVSATLKDLVIKNNQRAHDGGAIYLIESPLLTAEGCTFEKNVANAASRNGGAIYVKSSKLSLRNCAFKENTSGADGGAIYLIHSNLSAENVIFDSNSCRTGNTALPTSASKMKIGQGGGALFIKADVSETITAEHPIEVALKGCTFKNNHATYSAGGAFYSITSHLKLTADKCKFIGNKSNGNYAGAVFAFEQPTGAVEDNLDYAFFNSCEFRGNAAQNFTSNYGPHIAFVHYAYTCLGFNNCLFYGNSTTSSLYALYTRGSLIFANSTFVGSNSKGSTSLINAANVAESYPVTVYNSIMLNTSSNRLGFTTNDWTSSYLNYNYNLFGTYTQNVPSTNVQITSEPSGSSATTYDDMADGMSFYSWNGSIDGFTKTDKAAIKSAIEGNAKFGTEYFNWLTSLKDADNNDALDVDIRGVKRNGSYWPGSYQN